MLDFTEIEKIKNATEVGTLRETSIRAEAAYYELLDDLMEKFPSLEQVPSYGSNGEPKASLITHYGDNPSEIYARLYFKAPFDEVMRHATDLTMEQVIYAAEKIWHRRGVKMSMEVRVTAPLAPDYLQTLRDLGKVKRFDPPSYSAPRPREEIYCPLNNGSDDLPF